MRRDLASFVIGVHTTLAIVAAIDGLWVIAGACLVCIASLGLALRGGRNR